MEPLEQPLFAPVTEGERVRNWRLEQFIRLGYAYPIAESLAESDADLGRIRILITRGCSLELAAWIVG